MSENEKRVEPPIAEVSPALPQPLSKTNQYPRGGETFLAKVAKGWRITLYEPVRESLGIEVGDRVRVTVRKDARASA